MSSGRPAISTPMTFLPALWAVCMAAMTAELVEVAILPGVPSFVLSLVRLMSGNETSAYGFSLNTAMMYVAVPVLDAFDEYVTAPGAVTSD